MHYQSSKGQVKGLFILTRDSIRPYLTISERTCIHTVQLAQPIRCYVHWRTQDFKIEGFVCKRFLPSPPPPPSFIFWLSFHFSSGQNRESRSSIFLYPKTKRKRLLRRLESHVTLAFSPLLYLLETSIECLHVTSRRPYWCPKTMKGRPCWCPKPILWELYSFLMQTLSFVPINLHRWWPRE